MNTVQPVTTDDGVKVISKTTLYKQLKVVSDDVMQHQQTYVVFQGSKPAFKITPIDEAKPTKKYRKEDIYKFMFKSKHPDKDLARNYKKYLYS